MTIVNFLRIFFEKFTRAVFVVLTAFFLVKAVVDIRTAKNQVVTLSVGFFTDLVESSYLERDFLYLQRVSENFAKTIGNTLDLNVQLILRKNHKLLIESAQIEGWFFAGGSEVRPLLSLGEQTVLEVKYNFAGRLWKTLLSGLLSFAVVFFCMAWVRNRLQKSLNKEFVLLEELGGFVGKLEQTITETGAGFTIESESSLFEIQQIVKSLNFFSVQLDLYSKRLSETAADSARHMLARQLAHDIRSPLSALSVVLSIEKNISPEKREVLNAALQRIESIAAGLLDSKKTVKSGSVLREMEFKELYEELLVFIQEKKAEYSAHPFGQVKFNPVCIEPRRMIRWAVDNDELKRVLSNLINNGMEALRKKDSTVMLDCRFEGRHLLFAVVDNGVGMSEEVLAKAGERAFTQKTLGHGLGLSHARDFARECGGQLKLTSALNSGTSVVLLIPFESPHPSDT